MNAMDIRADLRIVKAFDVESVSHDYIGILFLAATFAMIVLGTVLVPLRVAWDFSDEIADWIADRYGRLIEWTTP